MQKIDSIIHELKKLGEAKNREGMARFGIQTDNAFGVSMPVLRKFGRAYKHDHELALELWKTGIHEAMILASIIDDPKQVSPDQMDDWVKDFDSWDVCDQACSLFDKTPHAVTKIKEWVSREREFEKRGGFALLAELAWHSKNEPDQTFMKLLPLIEQGANDDRNFVKKAVNWALREIGKRSHYLNQEAIEVAVRLKNRSEKSARWIGSDAYRELTDPKQLARIK